MHHIDDGTKPSEFHETCNGNFNGNDNFQFAMTNVINIIRILKIASIQIGLLNCYELEHDIPLLSIFSDSFRGIGRLLYNHNKLNLNFYKFNSNQCKINLMRHNPAENVKKPKG